MYVLTYVQNKISIEVVDLYESINIKYFCHVKTRKQTRVRLKPRQSSARARLVKLSLCLKLPRIHLKPK